MFHPGGIGRGAQNPAYRLTRQIFDCILQEIWGPAGSGGWPLVVGLTVHPYFWATSIGTTSTLLTVAAFSLASIGRAPRMTSPKPGALTESTTRWPSRREMSSSQSPASVSEPFGVTIRRTV